MNIPSKLIQLIFLLMLGQGLLAQQNYTLPDAIDYALEHHPSLHSATLDGVNAEWQYKEALSTGLPRITGNVDYNYYYKVPVTPTEDFITPLVTEAITGQPYTGPVEYFEFAFLQKNQFNVGLRGEVLVFDGNFLKGLKASKLFINLAKRQVELSEQDVIQNVVRAYQNVLIAKENIDIIQDNINNVTDALNETQIMYDNGFVEELDVDRLKLSLDNLITEKEKIVELIQVSKNLLKYQMAYPIDEPIDLTDNLEEILSTMMLVEDGNIGQIDYTARPEHRLLVDALTLDHADYVRIKQAYLPSVSANAGYTQSLQRNSLFNGDETGFLANGAVGLTARIPIYDGGNTKAKLQQKKIEIEKREIELAEFDRGMRLQVMNASTQYENAKKTLESVQRTLDLNEKIYNTTQIKYKEGVGSSIEVTQAESSLYQAQANYINALYDVLTTRTELAIASGELLKNRNK